MGLQALLIAIITVATIAASPAFATDFVVGDDAGWKLGVNYAVWAEGKQFFVGDRLVFKSGVGAHGVYRVNGSGFRQCGVPPPSEALTPSHRSAGRKWYICGVGKHCALGMKLVISVYISVRAPTASPAPPPLMQDRKPFMSFWSNWKFRIRF